jgi:hypothetical protein
MARQIGDLLHDAKGAGWRLCKSDPPATGERVDVMHVLSRQYDTDGEVDADGQWHCSNGFVLPGCPYGVLTFSPTHWRPRTADDAARVMRRVAL